MALLGADDMKQYYEFMGDFTKVISGLVESFGGLEGILGMVSVALMKLYQP
jgi:hypothetical protein